MALDKYKALLYLKLSGGFPLLLGHDIKSHRGPQGFACSSIKSRLGLGLKKKKMFLESLSKMDSLKIFASNFYLGKAHSKPLALVMGDTSHHSVLPTCMTSSHPPHQLPSLFSHRPPIPNLPKLRPCTKWSLHLF